MMHHEDPSTAIHDSLAPPPGDIVVLSTVVEATDRDYRLFVLSDGTEDADEQARDVLLGRIFPRRAQIIDTATLRGLLSP
jgi:nicotinamidase-related amidase